MTEPVVYRYGTDPSQFGELWLPEGATLGTVALLHGGFWRARHDLSRSRPLAADLAARGYAAWNLEYRRSSAGGGWPSTFEDVAAGLDLLAELPVPADQVIAVGHSAGGHLAVWAAGRSRLPDGLPGARPRVALAGVVSQAGVLALADCARDGLGDDAALEFMSGGPDALPEPYRVADPMAAVPVPAAVVCLHSHADRMVPFSFSERYVAAATAVGGRATLMETSGNHFAFIDPTAPAWAATLTAITMLKPRERL